MATSARLRGLVVRRGVSPMGAGVVLPRLPEVLLQPPVPASSRMVRELHSLLASRNSRVATPVAVSISPVPARFRGGK